MVVELCTIGDEVPLRVWFCQRASSWSGSSVGTERSLGASEWNTRQMQSLDPLFGRTPDSVIRCVSQSLANPSVLTLLPAQFSLANPSVSPFGLGHLSTPTLKLILIVLMSYSICSGFYLSSRHQVSSAKPPLVSMFRLAPNLAVSRMY